MKSATQGRQTHIDSLRLIASQFIVLHHFVTYGPLAKALDIAAPALTDWFFDYARMAVQVFLVLGGYLAVRSLAPNRQVVVASPLRTILLRYLRLAMPLLVALLMAVGSAALARHWIGDHFIPEAPTRSQLLAHVMLLQGVLGVDSLSAGVWYVAIDFQLFALMALLLWPGQRRHWRYAPVLGLMLASLFFFNLDEGWDNWAIYFFGAYGLGAAAFWAANSRHPGWRLGLLASVGLLALVVNFRNRIALALAVALILGLLQWRSQKTPLPLSWPTWILRLVRQWGHTSYALFLVHFSVLMLGNALFAQMKLSGAWAAALVLLGSWLTCLALAKVFERWVERPLARLSYRLNKGLSRISASRPVQSNSPRSR